MGFGSLFLMGVCVRNGVVVRWVGNFIVEEVCVYLYWEVLSRR